MDMTIEGAQIARAQTGYAAAAAKAGARSGEYLTFRLGSFQEGSR